MKTTPVPADGPNSETAVRRELVRILDAAVAVGVVDLPSLRARILAAYDAQLGLASDGREHRSRFHDRPAEEKA